MDPMRACVSGSLDGGERCWLSRANASAKDL